MKGFKRILSVVLVLTLLLSSMAVIGVSAADDTKIYFEVPSDWNNYSSIYCHIWPVGEASFFNWQSKKEKCTLESDGLYSYDMNKVGGLVEDKLYCVIFSSNTGVQTYDLVFDKKCIGDTAYCDGTRFENPADSNKIAIAAYWKNQDPDQYGPVLGITSIGNVVGSCEVMPTEELFADFLTGDKFSSAQDYSGKTDQQIIDDVISAIGLSRDDAVAIIEETGVYVNWVAEMPFVSITCEDVVITEKTNGHYSDGYDEETDEEKSYYVYDISNLLEYEIELKDGSTIYDYGSYFYYDDQEYVINVDHNQSYENQWGVGTHTAQVTLGDLSTTVNIIIEESPFESIICEDIVLEENCDGHYTKDYNFETGEYESYFEYDFDDYLKYKIVMKDGSFVNEEGTWFYYDGESYTIDCYTDQSCENQWGVGTHTAQITMGELSTTVNVIIKESPFERIDYKDINLYEFTDGDYEENYDWDTDEWISYYVYDISDNLEYDVVTKDGSVIHGSGMYFEYNDKTYNLVYNTDQSYENQWGVGKHTAEVTFAGMTTEVNVNVVAPPFASISCEDINLIEKIDGHIEEDYDEDTDDYITYFAYDVEDKLKVAVTLTDGTVIYSSGRYVKYDGKLFDVNYSTNQAYNNQWGAGKHTAEVTLGSLTTTVNVNIAEYPYTAIEIISVDPVDDSDIDNFNRGVPEYNTPYVKYKLIKNDGTYTVAGYSEYSPNNDPAVSVRTNQDENPWYPGGDNKITIYYTGGLSDEATVQVLTSDFTYIEQNGGLYITDYLRAQKDVVVPSEINGVPVVGILSLSSGIRNMETLTIPDSVVSLGEDLFKTRSSALKTLNLGSGVSYVDPDISYYCANLEQINVSKDNKTYAAIDGVLYNKAKDTLVVYPVAQGKDFKLPASVSNIDVLGLQQYRDINLISGDGSLSYVTKDGVTYTADMKRIVRCDSSKSGVYEMPSSVESIGEYAFSGCDKLTEIKVSAKVTDLVYGTFSGCKNLKNVTLPESLKSIGPKSFEGCYELDSIDIPSSVASIGAMAFNGVSMESLTLPDSLKTIEGRWNTMPTVDVINVNSLETLRNLKIDGSIFNGAKLSVNNNVVTELVIPSNWTSINAFAFNNCDSITSVIIPDSVKTVGASAFSDCDSITSVVISDGVENVGVSAFNSCDNLKSITIGKGITTIESSCFSNCASLEKVTIPANIKYVADGAFDSCENLKEVDFKSKSTLVCKEAFLGTGVENLVVSDEYGTYTINKGVFKGVKIADTVTSLVYGAYSSYDDQYLTDIELPENLIQIGGRSFSGTKWYNNQNDGPVYLDHVFLDYKGTMPGNTSLKIKDGTTSIADYAFDECKGLTSVTLPTGLKRIGTLSFHGCENLTSIHIPASVSEIGNFAFANCDSLSEITVDENNEYFSVQNGVLYNKDKTELIWCAKQTSDRFVIPIRVERVRAFAFGESGLKHISIPSTKIEFEDYALGYSYAKSMRGEIITIADFTCLETIKCHAGSTAEMFTASGATDIDSENTGGDVTGDGELTIKDATTIQKNIASLMILDETALGYADYDFNGDVNIRDVTAIQLYLADLA